MSFVANSKDKQNLSVRPGIKVQDVALRIEELEQVKAEAIQNEDYLSANTLKQRIESLKKLPYRLSSTIQMTNLTTNGYLRKNGTKFWFVMKGVELSW